MKIIAQGENKELMKVANSRTWRWRVDEKEEEEEVRKKVNRSRITEGERVGEKKEMDIIS